MINEYNLLFILLNQNFREIDFYKNQQIRQQRLKYNRSKTLEYKRLKE